METLKRYLKYFKSGIPIYYNEETFAIIESDWDDYMFEHRCYQEIDNVYLVSPYKYEKIASELSYLIHQKTNSKYILMHLNNGGIRELEWIKEEKLYRDIYSGMII